MNIPTAPHLWWVLKGTAPSTVSSHNPSFCRRHPPMHYDYSSLVQLPPTSKCPVSGCLNTFQKKASLTAHLRNAHKGMVLDSATESQLQLARCPKCTGYYCSAGVNAHAAGCKRGTTPVRTPLAAQLNSNRAQQSLVPPPPPTPPMDCGPPDGRPTVDLGPSHSIVHRPLLLGGACRVLRVRVCRLVQMGPMERTPPVRISTPRGPSC